MSTVFAPPNVPGDKCIGLITLNRPEALNAIDVRMRVEFDLLLDQIRRDDRLRVIVITGEGRGFSAGGDLRSEAAPLGALDDELIALCLFIKHRLNRDALTGQCSRQALRALRCAFLVRQADFRIYQQGLEYCRVDDLTHAVDHRFGKEILFRNLL